MATTSSMDNGIVEDIAWPVNIETMALEQKQIEEEEKSKKHRKICGFPLFPCLLLSLLSLLLAALLTYLLTRNRHIISVVANMTNDTYQERTYETTLSTITTLNSTTPVPCGSSCLQQSWINDSSLLAYWSFDNTYNDKTGVYNRTTSSNLPTLVTGYLGQAALFNASAQQALYISHMPINSVSFTIEAWIKPTAYPNPVDHSIVGLCPSEVIDHCLHINIRHGLLYFGFYYDDVRGGTSISLNRWIHVAFVFETTTNMQTIYLNGYPDAAKPTVNVLQVSTGAFTIATNERVSYPDNFFQGYIDELTITQRAKSLCEIVERATLAAYFKFDTSAPYSDSGPNRVPTLSSATSIVAGNKSQSVSFTGTSSSYFQTWGYTSFGITDHPFSITLWIQPRTLAGTLVHLSSTASGTGSTCFPLLGFSSTGAIVGQVLTSSNTLVSTADLVAASSSSWTLVVLTWSSTKGLRLYINDELVSSAEASTFLASETTPNYFTLGNCLSGCTACPSGTVSSPGPFVGLVDDLRIFSREITADDVCILYTDAD
ncbi:unnamed protein product [Adineta ricciae]|uniref:LamG-like jellyroll fold domain-containing protein n=1 Tax=Adineta ricciae TaxID=249248 RepID=A0A814EG76_ADIRI|nr:unnamed protein product [Adineta ricciae]